MDVPARSTPQVDQRRVAGRGMGWILLIAIVSAVLTAAIVQASRRQGRLTLPPTFDDVTYMLDAAYRLRTLDESGTLAVLKGYADKPPHSPLSTALALAAFALFGLEDWAPYAANGLLLFLILAFVRYRSRPLPPALRWACIIAVACLPLSIMSVFQFRPDIASAALTAIGATLLLEGAPGALPVGRSVLVGACFGASMLAKPTSSPATLLTFAACAGLRWILDFRESAGGPARDAGRLRPLIRALRTPALAAGALVLIAGPHFLLDGVRIWSYIHYNMFGAGRGFWTHDRPASENLLYYLTGDGGAFMLGSAGWALLVLAMAPVVVGRMRGQGTVASEASLLAVTALLLTVSVATPVKQRFFGAPFQAMLIFNAAAGVAVLARAGLDRPQRVWRISGIALPIALAAVMVLTFRWPDVWAPPNGPRASAIRRVLGDLNGALRDASAGRPAHVMLTFTGPVNGPTLEWLALCEGRPIETRSAEAAKRVRDYNYLLLYWGADLAVACDSGTGLTATNFPSAALQDEMVRYFQESADWERVAVVPGLGAPSSFYVYRRRPVGPGPPAAPAP